MRSITDVNRGIKSLIASCCVPTSSLLRLLLLKCKYPLPSMQRNFYDDDDVIHANVESFLMVYLSCSNLDTHDLVLTTFGC